MPDELFGVSSPLFYRTKKRAVTSLYLVLLDATKQLLQGNTGKAFMESLVDLFLDTNTETWPLLKSIGFLAVSSLENSSCFLNAGSLGLSQCKDHAAVGLL